MAEPVVPSREWARGLVAARSAHGSSVGPLHALCEVVAREVEVWADLSVMTPTGPSLLGVDDPTTALGLVEMQATAGEGPVYDAYAALRPVLVPDLAHEAGRRWPGFAAAVAPIGVGAVFAFPLTVGAIVAGVLQLSRDRAGPLMRSETAVALTFAEVATEFLLDEEEHRGVDGPDGLAEQLIGHRGEIYQAQGMVMVGLGISLEAALARMRAHAFAHDLALAMVAAEIVAGRLRLEQS